MSKGKQLIIASQVYLAVTPEALIIEGESQVAGGGIRRGGIKRGILKGEIKHLLIVSNTLPTRGFHHD